MVRDSPTPRYDSVASVTMNTPSQMVVITISGPAALGSTCRSRIRNRDTPSAFAAVTYSLFLAWMTAPRAIRAACGQVNEARISITVNTVRDSSSCMITIAASISGSAKKISAIRDTTESNRPP